MGSEENKKKKVTKYPPGGDVLFSDGDNANPESEQPSQGVRGTGWFFRGNKMGGGYPSPLYGGGRRQAVESFTDLAISYVFLIGRLSYNVSIGNSWLCADAN